MDLFIIIVGLAILAETTYLLTKSFSNSQKHNKGRRKLYVDTSALIDGRILEAAKTGFISDDFIIPRSVTRELQLLADGKDSEKRKRARDGLSTINELERVVYFDTSILDDAELGNMPVDERLLTLARKNNGTVLTCDYNLCKVAETEHIKTLNINDLVMALGFKHNIGEQLCIKILERGNNPGQGVGHLQDGTMVVVDNASELIGKEVDIKIGNFIQTSSGRMVFATLVNNSRSKAKARKIRR